MRVLAVGLAMLAGLMFPFAACKAGHPDDPGAHYQAACHPFPPPGTSRDHCFIIFPTVTQDWTTYPEIQINQGDIVDISASGCVQTGGKGKTWKDFINPKGENADHLYFGLFRLRSPTATLVAARRFTNPQSFEFRVPTGVAVQFDVGYVDDVYDDNGYWGHDEGNPPQCQSSDRVQVIVDIVRSGLPAIPWSTTPPPPPVPGSLIAIYCFNTGNFTDPSASISVAFTGKGPTAADTFSTSGSATVTPNTRACVTARVNSLKAGQWSVTARPNAFGAPGTCPVTVPGIITVDVSGAAPTCKSGL